MTFCPHTNTRQSTKLIAGQTVIRCLDCNSLTVEGSRKWCTNGEGFIETLHLIIAQRDADRTTMAAIMNSDADDPRWDRLD